MRGSDRTWRQLLFWGMAAAVACTWFLTLDARHLLPADEGRYAEIAREMLASGDWITIRYNGLKYFEKPPFQIWMTALAFKAFGVGEWQARLWVAISGAAGLLITAEAARRWFGPRVAVMTGLVLLALPAWNLGSHFNSLDMGVSGALGFVLAAVLIALHPSSSKSAQRRWMWAAWAAMGVAALTKGLIGIALPALVLIVYTLVARDFSIWRRLQIPVGVLLFLAITEPWLVLVSQRNPEFLNFFFVHEHFQRFISTVHRREGAWWYFIPIALVGFLPWLPLSPAMVRAVRSERITEGFRPVLLLVVWAASIFVFFSLSSSKLPGYLLPIYPALAIIAAIALDRLRPAQWGRQLLILGSALVCALLAMPVLARLGSSVTPNTLYRDFIPWVVASCLIALVGLVIAWRLKATSMMGSIVACALAFFLAETVAMRGHEVFGRSSSGVSLVARIEAVSDRQMSIYSVKLLDHTLPFYLRRTMVMVQEPGELEFGTQQEPDKWLPSLDAFESRWTSGPHALALMSPQTYELLSQRHLPMTRVAADTRRVVVANFEPAPK